MHIRRFIFFIFLVLNLYCPCQAQSSSIEIDDRLSFRLSSPFSIALETLQGLIEYNFTDIGLLRRAMTHSSYSEENNRALSILGQSVIETWVSLRLLTKDIDISPKDLNSLISEVSEVETSCAVDGMKLKLQSIVRVSPKTDPSTPSVVCGAFRAMFGAIAVDTGKADVGGSKFGSVHEKFGRARAMMKGPKIALKSFRRMGKGKFIIKQV